MPSPSKFAIFFSYSSLSFLHFMNSRRVMFDKGVLDAPGGGHKVTVMSSGEKKSVHVRTTLPWDQTDCGSIINTFITDSCLTTDLTNSFSM